MYSTGVHYYREFTVLQSHKLSRVISNNKAAVHGTVYAEKVKADALVGEMVQV